ncbi:MAG: GEVED domain-containing protein [Pirellulaceae bacterium]
MGELAPNLQSGDENRRLGFVVDGAITTRDELDVYSFVAASKTEVWLDIDRTGNQFDSVVELIDANGRVLASSNDSILAETNPAALYTNVAAGVNSDAAQSLSVVRSSIGIQKITIAESVVDATGGVLVFTHAQAPINPANGQRVNATLPIDVFLASPAASIAAALESQFPELGSITATLSRRDSRVVDPTTNNLLRAGDDFVIQLQFDESLYVGSSVPAISASSLGLLPSVSERASVSSSLTGSQLQDDYSSNPKDAGMRLRLPGEANTRNLYHIRVRSSNVQNPLDTANLVDPAKVRDGLTVGRYELQVRIREQDERPGTQVRLADIRYATTGLQIIGQPLHSPLTGEEHETTQPNDLRSEAQRLGYFSAGNDIALGAAGPLQSDTLSKSFGGELSGATDVDWYQFDIQYENLTRDGAAHYLSTVFDLDYASNFARSDMALYVFDSTGALILVGGDSNVADDQPGSATSNDTGDLSRGSAGSQDPYIGAAELPEGSYFVAVANQDNVPLPLDQFFNAASLNPLLRLEPITSVRRIAEDHIFSSSLGIAADPEVPVLFDGNSFQEYSFDDTLLYVNTSGGLVLVNPFTGASYGNVGNFTQNRTFSDVAFTSNGELFGYSDFVGGASDSSWFYHQIDTGNASLSAPLSVGANLTTFQWDGVIQLDGNGIPVGIPTLNVVSNTGIAVEAITIRQRAGVEEGFFIGNRPDIGALGVDYFTNVLYRFDERTGNAQGANVNPITVGNAGAGTSPREVGQLDTAAPATALPIQLGITAATEIDSSGVARQSIFDGNTFTLDDLTNPAVTFEFDQSVTLTAFGNNPVRDGDAIQIDGTVFEFNTGARVQLAQVAPAGLLSEGSVLSVTGANGQNVQVEFVRFGQAAPGNVAVSLVDSFGTPRPIASITSDTANAINASIALIEARSNADEIFFVGDAPTSLTSTGAGVNVVGNAGLSNPTAIGVSVDETIAPEALINALAEVILANGIAVSASGTQLALPASNTVTIIGGNSLTISGNPGVTPGNIPILLLPTDSAQVLAQRIETAVMGQLPNVTATAQGSGRSLSIAGAIITNVNGANLTAGGVATGGTVTGIELVGGALYAVTDTGGLYSVSSGELFADANRQIGQYVRTATDLVGINFSGLRAGPASVQDGELSNILFGITFNGDIYAFNTLGELQPVFAGGRSVISTNIFGAQGLDFSTLDYNLWHVTSSRGGSLSGDAGHGIEAIDSYRSGTVGGNSLAFNYQGGAQDGNYASLAERPQNQPRLDGQNVLNTYNFPGGAKGVVNSNQFSLEGYSSNDKPVLYFNYFMESDVVRDRLRVYVVTEDGIEHLVASNSLYRAPGGSDDEFDDPSTLFAGYDDTIDVQVQQIFDGTDSWRQARVPLGDFAGQRGLGLRIEFTTNGTTDTFSQTMRTVAGDILVDGQTFRINGEDFVLDFAPTLYTPSGSQLADLYFDPNQQATLSIDGQEYLLNDGTRTPTANQISIDLLNNTAVGTTLANLSAQQIATAIAEGVRVNPPPNPLIAGFNFSDPEDAAGGAGRNDFIYEATPLPYSGGNLTISGSGRLGTDPANGPVTHIDDVDLLQVDVASGTTISVDANFDFNTNSTPVVRFFDSEGTPLAATLNQVDGTVDYTATADGVVFIGISGVGNNSYDPRLPGTAAAGLVDGYTATINLDLSTAILTEGNTIEFNGLTSLLSSPSDLFTITGTDQPMGLPVRLSQFMTATEVATQVQRAIANRFTDGNTTAIPTSGPSVTLPGFVLQDTGPFVESGLRYADQFNTDIIPDLVNGDLAESSLNNDFEGVYLDDFIIGFAERGEVATNSNVVDTAFVGSGLRGISVPGDPVSSLQTGTYQVEIRDASEYVNAAPTITTSLTDLTGAPRLFRAFDTNDRLIESARSITAKSASEIRDGFTFSIFDGRSEVEFEFDLIESNTGVTPGRVRIPYTLLAIEPGTESIDANTGLVIPGTGVIRPQTASEVATSIIAAINRSDVQSLIDVPALPSSGVDAVVDARINLFGDVAVTDSSEALAAISLGANRGDTNRERESQGVILIENSRFLSNQQYGIAIDHDVFADINGTQTESIVRYPRNLIELNTESLVPGVVVQSNVFAFNGTGGLQVTGIDGALTETGNDPVSYERIVNNTFIGGSVTAGTESPAATINGVLFAQGTISFADAVTSYRPNAGGSPPLFAFQDSTTVLGAPDGPGRGPEPIDGSTTVSLGLGGSITVEFTDNLLTGSGNARPDLIVFESGAVESVRVEISRDGVDFFDVGVLGGLTNQLDIDAAGFGLQDRFAFVRLTDVRQGDIDIAQLGADIDAIGALSTTPVDTYTPGGIGINIVGDAAPTVLNNVISNANSGVIVDPANAGIVLGGNSYYRNVENVPTGVALGQFSQVLSPSEVVFVGAADLVFVPAAGASIIDSSIDSLEERPSLTTVRNPLGIPASPILAPRLDVNGQLRVDDPNVETPNGFGERVFKDRGASDRGDLAGPRAVLLSPRAPGLGIGAGVVNVLGNAPAFFEVQLVDGLSPADVTPGTGVDDRTIDSGSLLLLKDNVALIEGVDYRFGYNPSTNIIRLTPIAGVWEQDSTYVIRMVDASDAVVAAVDADTYTDGGVLNVLDTANGSTSFEYELGIQIELSTSLTGPTADGIVLDIFDGSAILNFELDSDGIFDAANNVIQIPPAGTAAQIAQAIANAVNLSDALNFTAATSESRVQLLGGSPLSSVAVNNAFVSTFGTIGTSSGFGFQIPNDFTAPADTIVDGQTFIIRRGAIDEVIFEFDTNGVIDSTDATGATNAIGISIAGNPTLDQIANEIVRVVGGVGLGLDPSNAGAGRVYLGPDTENYSIVLTDSTLTQIGVPGGVPAIPISIPINLEATDVAAIIEAVIDARLLPGVSTTLVDTRVFIEGTGGVNGVGAVDLIIVADEVGNQLQSNLVDGRTQLTIFIGSGFDYGDAPSPYSSLSVDNGPTAPADASFTIGATVTPDSNALLVNADTDDGVTLPISVQAGFAVTDLRVSLKIPDARTNTNPTGRTWYMDVWFDWNGNGVFENNSIERTRFGSSNTGRTPLAANMLLNTLQINVPADAKLGETYARFRLSEVDIPGPNGPILFPAGHPLAGQPAPGEIEDYKLIVTNNPFQNPTNAADVNASGFVTPLDVLQVINLLASEGSDIDLSTNVPAGMPPFPDVDANGRVTPGDILAVINFLAEFGGQQQNGNGEQAAQGEFVPAVNVASSFLPMSPGGVLTSTTTFLGDALLNEQITQVSSKVATTKQAATSVFDSADSVKLDSLVDDLAADTSRARSSQDGSIVDGQLGSPNEIDALDQLFAQL